MPESELYRVPLKIGTRLTGLVRVRSGNRQQWQVWIAIRNPSASPERWEGTYLLCDEDGSVTRVTSDGGVYDEFEVVRAVAY